MGLVIVLLAAGSPAQEPQEQRPAVTFRTGVDLVAVDVSVVDRNGRPVENLEPDDFALTVDGRPRTLVSVQFIRHVRQAAPQTARDPRFSSNRGAASGRLIMLVIDQANIRRGSGRAMIDAAQRFIDRLSPADRVGLTVIPGAGQNIDFTTNHALVKTLVGRVVGRATHEMGQYHVGIAEAVELQRRNQLMLKEMIERECIALGRADEFGDPYKECALALEREAQTVLAESRARTDESLVGLRHVLANLADSREVKTIVFISEGLVLQDRVAELSWVGPLAAAAHASLYVLRLDAQVIDAMDRRVSATLADDVRLGAEGLGILAGMARGAMFPVTPNTDFLFERLELELSGYYLLSFEPEGADRDGRPHAIEVRVARDRVEVRARREFVVDADRTTMTDEELLAETLRDNLLATELPLQVTTHALRDLSSGQLKILMTTEVDRREGAVGDLSMAYALVDDNGRLVTTQIEKALAVAPGSGDVQSISSAVLVDPGTYTLKLAVIDAEGRRGSVEHTVRARLQSAGQLHFGDLVLAEVRSGAQGRSIRPVVSPEISADAVHAYFEMYSDATEQLEAASVDLEVAADPNARALESASLRLEPVEAGRRRVGETSVPTIFLPPGDYVARAVVSVSGRPVGRVTRAFRITRPLPAADAESIPPPPGSSPRVALSATIEGFDRSQVLAPAVVSFFVDRMFVPGSAPPSVSMRAVIDEARAGRFDALQAELDRLDPAVARELTPTFLRGIALLSLGDLEGAAGRFRESLRISSEYLPAAFYLGACYAAGGRDREAVGAWQTSLVTEHDAPFVYTLLGDALMRLNEGMQAVDIMREASALWPDNDDVRARLGTAYALAARGGDALDTLDPYFERHPDDHARLFVAMRILYETKAAGWSIGTPEEDRARFERYARAYLAAGGSQDALVEQWLQYMRNGG